MVLTKIRVVELAEEEAIAILQAFSVCENEVSASPSSEAIKSVTEAIYDVWPELREYPC